MADGPMTSGQRAGEVFAAAIGPASGGPLRRRVRWAAAFLSEATGGLLPPPSVAAVVVTRRADGEVVATVESDLESVDHLLEHLRDQLVSLDVQAFTSEWGIPDDGGASAGRR